MLSEIDIWRAAMVMVKRYADDPLVLEAMMPSVQAVLSTTPGLADDDSHDKSDQQP